MDTHALLAGYAFQALASGHVQEAALCDIAQPVLAIDDFCPARRDLAFDIDQRCTRAQVTASRWCQKIRLQRRGYAVS